MTVKDWFDVAIPLVLIALTAIAGYYTRNKTKIDTKTAAGKAFDTVGKLAVWAVNEAEFSGMDGESKREYAAEIITEQLAKRGITGINKNVVYGAIQTAWKAAEFEHSEPAVKEAKDGK